jgi:response regulator RpfG family c-di-GMP phosphodiesterase
MNSGNRNELLGKLSSLKREQKAASQNAAARSRIHDKAIAREKGPAEKSSPTSNSNKPKVIIFGKQRLFFGTLKSSLESYFEVLSFDDIEDATDYLLDNPVPVVVMDMDPPTDWRECHDLFTTGKTMYPDTTYIVYQANKTPSTEVQILEKKGAIVQQKPLKLDVLVSVIKEATGGEIK